MKLISTILTSLIISFLISITGCKKDSDSSTIVYKSINEEYNLPRVIDEFSISDDGTQISADDTSSRNAMKKLASSGKKDLDIDNDSKIDVGFEILNLVNYNSFYIPVYLDSLAISAIPSSLEILDNSTIGYADALNANEEISGNSLWNKNTCILGSFVSLGKFNGKGEKYLGIRLIKGNSYNYGWIKVYCSEYNDTLKIIDYAYNKAQNTSIKAGQKE